MKVTNSLKGSCAPVGAQASKLGANGLKGTSQTPQTSQTHAQHFDFSDATFLYECMDATRNQRLCALFNGLKQLGWIDPKTSQQQFIDLFSGEPLYHRVKWTGSKQHLAYLFKLLIRQKMYVRTTEARIWITVRSHFVQANGQPFEADMNAQQVPGAKPSRLIKMLVEFLNPSCELPRVR